MNDPDPAPTDRDQTAPDTLGYASALSELSEILHELEASDVDVDKLADRVARATELIAVCRDRIGAARLRIDEVIADLDGRVAPPTSGMTPSQTLRATPHGFDPWHPLPRVSPRSPRASTERLSSLSSGRKRDRWAALDADLAGPFDEINRMVQAGGKRLRPAFCHWGFVGAGGDADDPRVVDVGAAFELMHAFALFHDDVMDDAATPSGRPDHARRLRRARTARRGGRASRADSAKERRSSSATSRWCLSDDLLIGVPDAAWRMWNELRTELNVGQFLDILGSVRRERRLDKAERIARYKSGKYTIERPLHLGALLAAPDRADTLLPQLSTFGLPLGDAFQMRDDVIGVFGDTAQTGKPVGGDLHRGQADPAARPCRRPGLAVAAGRRSTGWAPTASTPMACPRSSRSSSTPARWPSSRRRSTAWPTPPSTRSRAIDLEATATAELESLALYVVGRER